MHSANASAHDPGEMYTVTEYVTPEKALEYLERNRINRPLSELDVARLAWDIRTGAFVTTGQGIEFDVNGDLVDGQHRLNAIVRAGQGVHLRVTRNAPSVDATRDRGRIRSIGDFLLDEQGQLVEQPLRTTAICNAIGFLTTGKDERRSVQDIRRLYHKNRAGIAWALERLPGRFFASMQAAMVFAYPTAPRSVDSFATKFSEHVAEMGSPVIVLLKAMPELRAQRSKQRMETMLKTLRCLQLFAEERTVKRILNVEEGFHYFETARRRLGMASS
jgi:hypothetical protein